MKIAHLSDTHLGFRAYGRVSPEGINQREVDVMRTFEQTLEAILAHDPDLVLHTGDVFHQVRPSNHTVVQTLRLLQDFQSKRKGRPFLMVGGNHETPRTIDVGSILRLFEGIPGMIVAPLGVQRGRIEEVDTEYLAVPTRALEREEKIDYQPTLGMKYSVLGLHGMVREALPDHAHLSVLETQPSAWTYVGLGDYHVFKSFARNCAYPGSTDYASSNIWEESSTEKGWILFDTDGPGIQRVSTSPRPVVDLPRLDAAGLNGAELTAKLLENAQWPLEPKPIVRQVVLNVPFDVRSDINRRALVPLEQKSFRYQLDLRRPEAVGMTASQAPAASLEAEWDRYVQNKVWPKEIDPLELTRIGRELLQRRSHEAEEIEA